MSKVIIQYQDVYKVGEKNEVVRKHVSLPLKSGDNGTVIFQMSEEALNDLIYIARSHGMDISLRDLDE